MSFMHCCSALRKCRSFILEPEAGYIFSQMLYLERCPVCDHTKVRVLRIKPDNTILSFEKINKKACALLEKLKAFIQFEEKPRFNPNLPSTNFYLNYTDKGSVKKCFSNISTIKSGMQDPYAGIKEILDKKNKIKIGKNN